MKAIVDTLAIGSRTRPRDILNKITMPYDHQTFRPSSGIKATFVHTPKLWTQLAIQDDLIDIDGR